MNMRPRHPNKEIEAALRYAESKGWRYKETGRSAHAWGRMQCQHADRSGCQFSVWSTPRVPQNHADQIHRFVDRCPHRSSEGADDEP